MSDDARVFDPNFGNSDIIQRVTPYNILIRRGHVRPLKTVEEVGAGEALFEVYVTKIPIKAASRVLE